MRLPNLSKLFRKKGKVSGDETFLDESLFSESFAESFSEESPTDEKTESTEAFLNSSFDGTDLNSEDNESELLSASLLDDPLENVLRREEKPTSRSDKESPEIVPMVNPVPYEWAFPRLEYETRRRVVFFAWRSILLGIVLVALFTVGLWSGNYWTGKRRAMLLGIADRVSQCLDQDETVLGNFETYLRYLDTPNLHVLYPQFSVLALVCVQNDLLVSSVTFADSVPDDSIQIVRESFTLETGRNLETAGVRSVWVIEATPKPGSVGANAIDNPWILERTRQFNDAFRRAGKDVYDVYTKIDSGRGEGAARKLRIVVMLLGKGGGRS
jgi:hypothetical protein